MGDVNNLETTAVEVETVTARTIRLISFYNPLESGTASCRSGYRPKRAIPYDISRRLESEMSLQREYADARELTVDGLLARPILVLSGQAMS